MRASLHIGKGSAAHNDRSFDTKKNKSIKYDYENYNFVRKQDGKFQVVESGKRIFSQVEKEFYQKNFANSLKAKNDRYKNNGHKEKCKTMSNVLHDNRTKPTEIILQVGNEKEPYEDGEKFRKMVQQISVEMRNAYPNFVILDVSIHYDEESPHAHVRGVFVGKDKDGNLEPSQAGAFKEMNIERPNMDEPTSKMNCPLQTFTDEIRTKWQNVIKTIDQEVKLETEPLPNKRKHIDHKIHNAKKELEKVEENLKIASKSLKTSEKARYDAMDRYLDEKGLKNDFERYYNNSYNKLYENLNEIDKLGLELD